MDRRALLPWILFIILVILGFVIFAVGSSIKNRRAEESEKVIPEKTQETTENLTNLTPSDFDAKIKENLDMATSLAQSWKADAYLVHAQFKFDSLTPDEGTETYVFDSKSEPEVHFTFTISQKNKRFIRAAIPKVDYLGHDLLPIDFKYWKINYVTAFQIAEEEGGKEFRERNSDWSTEVTFSRGQPKNWLWCVVEYKSKSGDSLSVKINPFSGEVSK